MALFFRSEHSKWPQICTMPRKLSKDLAEFCLIGGPPNSRRILLCGIAIGPRRQISIAQHFFLMACPSVYLSHLIYPGYIHTRAEMWQVEW